MRIATDDYIVWILENAHRLVSLARLKVAVGRMTFCARFVPFGRALLNSSYSTLAGA